jgi:WD40 repeat protein
VQRLRLTSSLSKPDVRSLAVAVLTAVAASAQTFAPDRVFHGGSRMIRVSFSHDGNTVVGAGQDGTARVWDVKSGALLRTIQWARDFPFGVAIAPGGDALAAGVRPQTVNVWDLASGKIVHKLPGFRHRPCGNGWPAMKCQADSGPQHVLGGGGVLTLEAAVSQEIRTVRVAETVQPFG